MRKLQVQVSEISVIATVGLLDDCRKVISLNKRLEELIRLVEGSLHFELMFTELGTRLPEMHESCKW